MDVSARSFESTRESDSREHSGSWRRVTKESSTLGRCLENKLLISLTNKNETNQSTHLALIPPKFRPMDRYLMALFLEMAPTTPGNSISRLLSLKSRPETHLMPIRESSRTAAPLALNSLEDKLMRISAADSLHARPRRTALRASEGRRLALRLSVLRQMAVLKNFLMAAGTTRSPPLPPLLPLFPPFFELN